MQSGLQILLVTVLPRERERVRHEDSQRERARATRKTAGQGRVCAEAHVSSPRLSDVVMLALEDARTGATASAASDAGCHETSTNCFDV